MHPALLIPEIIYKVCDCFVIPADRKALLALSCTCKAFSEPANDALWRYIRGITTFSKMLFPDPPEEEVTAAGAWRSRSERFQAFVAEREVRIWTHSESPILIGPISFCGLFPVSA